MKIGIEGLKTLEYWAERQERLFQDSCDHGIWHNPKLAELLRQACRILNKEFKSNSAKWGTGCSWECFVPTTYSPKDQTFSGVQVRVAMCKTLRRGKKFFSIDIFRETTKKNPFRDEEARMI